MPFFVKKIKNLFKKQGVYRPTRTRSRSKTDKQNRTDGWQLEQTTQPSEQHDASSRQRPARNNRIEESNQESRVTKKKSKKRSWNPALFQVEPRDGKTRFQDLDLPDDILHAIADLHFCYCTPIQAEILPLILTGKDMAGRAQTGTGKTAAFLLGILTHFIRTKGGAPKRGMPRALILAPTRELAMQIRDDAEKLSKYTPFRTVAVYGGIDYDKQRKMLDRPVDIVVATPGRLIDFARQNVINLRGVEMLVIDEADRMLDMGFIPDVRRIVYKTPPKERRQTLLFSATLDDEVMRLASAWMTNPGKIEIEPDHTAAETVDQQVFIVTDSQKFSLLYHILKKEVGEGSALIFTNRRDQAERLSDELFRFGINCAMLSGAVPQKKRQRILSDFKDGRIKLVVATDVAGRGIHVDDITHVINFNIPQQPDDYIHRIGRTGRAGKKGISVTFACEMESFELPAIEELLGKRLFCTQPDPEMLQLPKPVRSARSCRESRPSPCGGNRRGGSNRSSGPRRR